MANSGKSILKSSSGLMIATLFSRVLGLFRVILEAGILGGGALAGAWQMAFMVPNLFRRLLGEGALGSALVPMISHAIVKEGKDPARQMLTLVLAVTGMILAGLCILIAGGSLIAQLWVTRPDAVLIYRLIPIVIPYAIFMCLIGVMSAALNSVKAFFLPALGALLMNIALISALFYLKVTMVKTGGDGTEGIHPGDFDTLKILGYAVLVSGVVQFIFTLALLYWYGVGLEYVNGLFKRFDILSELWRLTLPGLIGAAALQISFIVDRLLAFSIGPYAVPALNNTDRLIFLPISVFALSIGGVVLPKMSREAAHDDIDGLIETMFFGLRNLLFICIPVAVFILVFRVELLRAAYMRGRFGATALDECAWAMLFYAFGIPFFSSIKVVVAGFQSRKDMKTPMKVSIFCIIVNIVLNVILMIPLKQGGIVLATVISSLLNNAILLYILRKTLKHEMPFGGMIKSVAVSLGISVPLVLTARWGYGYCYNIIKLPAMIPVDLVPLAICGTAYVIVYFMVSRITGSKEAAGFMELLPGRRK